MILAEASVFKHFKHLKPALPNLVCRENARNSYLAKDTSNFIERFISFNESLASFIRVSAICCIFSSEEP
jgi:hypothetical protein